MYEICAKTLACLLIRGINTPRYRGESMTTAGSLLVKTSRLLINT
jgi:hypothetical protein